MSKLRNVPYNRQAAVDYAHTWAFRRNPRYYDFKGIGGDCTNFTSQCLYAGAKVMNYTPTFGWYYNNINSRAPAWTSVRYFYNFITRNKGVGPYGSDVSIGEMEIGDIVQMRLDEPDFQHAGLVVAVGDDPNLDNVLIAAHTIDSDNRPLSTYPIRDIRFIHIDGVRNY